MVLHFQTVRSAITMPNTMVKMVSRDHDIPPLDGADTWAVAFAGKTPIWATGVPGEAAANGRKATATSMYSRAWKKHGRITP